MHSCSGNVGLRADAAIRTRHQLFQVHDPKGDRRPLRSRITDVACQFPEAGHTTELFDALLGKVIVTPERFQIVLVLNEYGDFLTDMACGLAGSLGIGASPNLGFDAAAVVRVALFDAAHGTAPDIAGKYLANPTAIFLTLSLLLYQLGEITLGHTLKCTTLDFLREGV